ncbi:MAG: right-handed parallel beta-helix repeat-containing protein [Desulfobaccales bacterium]
MKRLGLLAMVLAVVLCGTAAWADFYVVAGGGPPVGTKITSLPYEIKNSGFYYLGGNLTYSGSSNAITVSADNVTLDLMGFSLSHPGPFAAGNGILMEGRYNVEIRNGTVSGFNVGILETNFLTGAQHRVSNVRAISNAYSIWLYGKNHLVNACNGSYGSIGIYVTTGVITGSVASNNGDHGIEIVGPGSIIGNIANDNGTTGFLFGPGIIMVDRNSASGNGTNYSGGGASTAWGVNAGK